MNADTVDWRKDGIEWTIDSKPIRSLKSAEFHIPELPMYMQMSIWPGGSSSAEGTRAWSGAPNGIDWNDPRAAKNNGTFTVLIKSVKIECGDSAQTGQHYKYIESSAAGEGISVEIAS